MNNIICYTTDPEGNITTETYVMSNVNHQKQLCWKLHQIANGLLQGQKITFYRER